MIQYYILSYYDVQSFDMIIYHMIWNIDVSKDICIIIQFCIILFISYYVIWFNFKIWCTKILYHIIWYTIIWYITILYQMISYHMILKWYNIISYIIYYHDMISMIPYIWCNIFEIGIIFYIIYQQLHPSNKFEWKNGQVFFIAFLVTEIRLCIWSKAYSQIQSYMNYKSWSGQHFLPTNNLFWLTQKLTPAKAFIYSKSNYVSELTSMLHIHSYIKCASLIGYEQDLLHHFTSS